MRFRSSCSTYVYKHDFNDNKSLRFQMTSTSSNSETPIDTIENVFSVLRQSFNSGKTKPVAWRKHQIEQMLKMCVEQKDLFASAAHTDFHRPPTETILLDCGSVSKT